MPEPPLWKRAQEAGLAREYFALLCTLEERGVEVVRAQTGWTDEQLGTVLGRIVTRLKLLGADEGLLVGVAGLKP
jgi:hypothetical protein